jgi:hypothetical protein
MQVGEAAPPERWPLYVSSALCFDTARNGREHSRHADGDAGQRRGVVVTATSVTYPKDAGGEVERAGVWAAALSDHVDRRILVLDGSMLRGEPR